MSDQKKDERVKEVSTIRQAMIRPELGAICGAILVFAFFLLIAGDSGMFSPKGIQNWTVVSAQFAIIAVGFITHNVRHALALGDRFSVLNRDKTLSTAIRGEISPEELAGHDGRRTDMARIRVYEPYS